MEVYVGQQRARDAPLWCPAQGFSLVPLFHDTCTQELPEQVSDIPVRYSLFDRLDSSPLRDRVKVACYVAFDDPLVCFPAWTCEPFSHGGHGIVGASIGPESIGVEAKVSFPYGFQDPAKGFLDNPIVNGWNTSWSPLPMGFRNVYPPDRPWFKGFGLECFLETCQVSLQVSVEIAHRFAVYARRFSSLVGVDSVMGYS